ncbi:MAG: glycosyl hydrolase family 28-related protein [Candidatus Acidiferrales bacterium]
MTRSEISGKYKFSLIASRVSTYLLLISALVAAAPPSGHAQGSRKDDIAFGATGRPIAGATVTVCSSGATGAPCSPLAALYTDATLSVPTTNPLQADGLGNYHFYAAPGRYVVQVSGTGINTYTMSDTILPNDPTTPSFNSVTATSITLGGNLGVGGNASVTGTLSAGTFAPSSISTGSLQVTGNASTKGPRPWADVVAWGADPTGAADSTSAIQSAINSACSSGSTGGGAVHFPPGSYKVLQPQTPSTAPVLTVPSTCRGLTLEGGSAYSGTGTQFSRPPQTNITVAAGSSPNFAPVLLLNQASSGNQPTTLRDLSISGYNQAVQLNATFGITFDNVCLSVANTGNGIRTGANDNTDNTPLAIYNTFTVAYRGGCLVNTAGNSTTPIAVFAFLAQAPPNLGLFQFRDVIGSGGGFIWDCRGTSSNSNCPNGGGDVFFDNVYIENATMPFYTINNSASSNAGGVPAIFHNAALFDCTNWAFMNYNGGQALGVTAGVNSPVYIENVAACPGGQLLTVTSGSVNYVSTDASPPQTPSGVPTGNAIFKSAYGMGLLSSNFSVCSQPVEEETIMIGGGGCGPTRLPPIALGQSGSTQATLGISPYYGHEFGDGTHYGYESSLVRNSSNTLDLSFSCALPPLNLTATPITGGTLANGTYYYSLQSICASDGSKSAGSNEVSVTLSGSNNAVSLSWTAPSGTDPSSCTIFRGTTSGGTFAGGVTTYSVSNCTSTTAYSDTGATGSAGQNTLYNATVKTAFRFSPPSGSAPATLFVPYWKGTAPTSGDCVKWGSGGLLQDAGSACGSGGGGGSLTFYAPPPNIAGSVQFAPSTTNAINVIPFLVPVQLQFSKLTIDIGTADSTGGDLYDVGIYSLSGALQCNWGATAFTATGPTDGTCAQGTVTLAPGNYIFAFTGNATTAKIYPGNAYNSGFEILSGATSSTSSSGGALPSTIAVPSVCPACGATTTTFASPFIVMH